MTFSLVHLSPEYSRFRRRLVTGLLAVACLVIVAVSWKIHSSYRERENAARAQTQSFVRAIAAHVSDSIQLADYALIGFANAIKLLPPEQRNSVATIQQLLARHDPASRDDFWTGFIDANGVGVASSKGIAVQGVSFADRDYFQAHAGAQSDQGLYVGEPLIARVSKRRIFTLSRRVVSAQGEFLGVIVAPVNAARFASIFELARFNDKDLSIALVHQGGKMIARAPLFEQTFAASLLDSNTYRQMRGVPERTFQSDNPFDGKPMIYSFRALENMPLNVFVAISVQALHQALQEDLLIGGAGILLIMAIMLLSAHVALHSYRRLEVSKQALQEAEFRLKFALEAAGEGVWDWNVASNAVYFSSDWKQMLGFADDVEMQHTFDAWKNGIHPDDMAFTMAALDACLKGKTPVYCSEFRKRCKDGSWKWMLGRGMVVSRDAAGQALRMTGTYADITDRKHAEQAQVHKIVEAAPDPMLLVGNDGIIIFANGAAQANFGYAFNELKGMNVDRLVPFHSRSSHAHYRTAFETSRTQHPSDLKRPLAAVYKDGTEFPVEISLSPFSMNGQPVVIASVRDISERKQAAELLQQSFTQLRRLSDHHENIKEGERKRIAQDIHDDLGQNLLALKMDVDSLYARIGDTHPKMKQRVWFALNNINATIKSVKAIINDLRPAALELGLYPAVAWQLRQFERRNGIACALVTIVPEPEFDLDDARISAVFRILQESLANVARHAQATEVEIALSQNQHGFSMQIKDNGKGLHPDDRRKSNSFGLLGIKERIHALGGELVIASSQGNGTVLSISIPVGEKILNRTQGQ